LAKEKSAKSRFGLDRFFERACIGGAHGGEPLLPTAKIYALVAPFLGGG
jgi:hypothetical protein